MSEHGTITLDDVAAERLVDDLCALDHDDPTRPAVRDRAIRAWLPLARRLAGRFSGRGEQLDDLVQVATIGLIKAIDRYDSARGCPFVHFAMPTILGEVRRHFRDHTWDVRVPRRLQELGLDIAQATDQLCQRLGRAPTPADLADHLGRSEKEVREAMVGGDAYSAVSLDRPVTNQEEAGTTLGDLVGGDDPALELADQRVALAPAMRALPPREQRILTLRFHGNLTQSEIAERVGLSQMHVSRLLAKSLATLRTQLVT
jgi:RNA polymerase sigma-B factor